MAGARSKMAWRVTNAQRAAVCGLIIAGQTFTMSCLVVGVPYDPMHRLVPDDWFTKKGRIVMPRKLRGELPELEQAYRDRKVPLATVALAFGVSESWIRRLAAKHGWRRRKPRLPSMSAADRRKYKTISAVVGRDRALNQMMREGGQWASAR